MKKISSVLDVNNLTSVLQRRCNSMGITLEWSQTKHIAMTDGQRIILPAIHQPVTQEALDNLYGYVIHECGHHSRAEAFTILNAAKPPQALCAMYNIVEDDAMERDVARAYAGDAKALGQHNARTIKKIGETWKETIDTWPDDITEQDMAPVAVTALSQLSRMSWDSYSNVSRHIFMNNLHPVAKKLTDDLVSEGWVDKMEQVGDEHDTWDLAVDLVKRLYPDADEEQLEECRQKGHDGPSEEGEGEEGEGQKGEGDGQGDGEAQGKGDNGEGNDGEGTGEGDATEGDGLTDGEGKLPGEGKVIHWKEAVNSQHDEWQAKDFNAPAGNIGIDWTDYKTGKVALMPQKLINVVDCTKKSSEPIEDHKYYRSCGIPEAFMPDNKESRAFANQIRRYVQAQARVRFERDKYHGRLDKGSIVKLVLPPIDGGEYNKRLFYQMHKAEAQDTCIMVLTDWSGSMQGQKMVHAADASGRLVQVFDRILRMPVQLAAFTNGRSRCDIGLIKKFDDRSVSPLDIASGFSKFYKYSSANNDADAVMWAYNQIRNRKENRKILMVLSDGCPAGTWMRGCGSSNLSYVTNHIQKEGKVELYGVGICSDAVETYYENVQVLEDETQINRALFEIIKGGVKNARQRRVQQDH